MWLRNSALALVSVAVGVALVELGARVFSDPPRYHALNHLEFHPELGLRQIPGLRIEFADADGPFSFQLSPEGLRGRPLPPPGAPPPPADVVRIAFLGDSFVAGLAIRDENLMTARTERALRERGTQAEVFNLSSTDYGTAQELLLLRRHAPRIHPDVVVLSLYPSNDLPNNAIELAGRTTGSPGDYIRPYLVPGPDGTLQLRYVHPLRAWLRRHLRLFAMLERGALGLGRRHAIAALAPWPERPGFHERVRAGRAPSEELEIHRPRPQDPAWQAAWATTMALLRAVRDESAALGARLLVFVIPRFIQVQRDATALHSDLEVRQAGGRPLDEQLDWNEPEATLARLLREEGIDVRIALDPFRAATAAHGETLYLRDGHLDALGHEVAAHEITEWLVSGRSSGAPRSDGPAPLLPPASQAPSLLDFGRARHEAHLVLGGGWLEYRSLGAGAKGWLTGASAELALPARASDLLVRGRVAAGTPLPLRVGVALAGGTSRVVSLAQEGPFEIRLRNPLGLSLHGYVVVELTAGPVSDESHGLSGLLVEEIGFEPDEPGGA